MNGGRGNAYFRFPESLPMDLGPTDRFSVIVRAERQIQLINNGDAVQYYFYLPAVTAIDVGQLQKP
jgi:hypothetical protein